MMSETEKYTDLETDTAQADTEEIKEEKTIVSETELLTEDIVESPDNELNQQEEETKSSSTEELLEAKEDESEPEISPEEDSEAKIAVLEAQIESLKTQVEIQTEQSQSIQSQYMRLNADFENFRRRTSKEKEELEQRAKKKTITELLSVVDNFERARSQIKPANDGEMTIHKSYQGVYKTFVESLKKIGVSAMRPEGKPFDPNYHEAMLREPTNEYPEGTVIEELVRGYLLNDEVLRHAMVKVATEMDEQPIGDNVNQTLSEE